MKIFISCLAFDGGKSGISDYIVSVTKQMIMAHHVDILIHPKDWDIFPLRDEKLKPVFVSNKLSKPIVSMFWHLFMLPVVHNLRHYELVFLPAGNRRLLARYPKNTVVTFHDLSQFHVPGKYDFLRMLYIKRLVPHYLKKAPHIFAISESTKRDMIKYYNISSNRIQVNYNGYDPAKLENGLSEEAMREKLGLKKKYMLYIGRIEHPGKNHLNLLKAYNLLDKEIKDVYDVVCAGGLWNGSEVVLNYAKEMKQGENIHFPGFVGAEEMSALYKYASLYVFPSLYEGFGIPMLEAFASGIPVVCSNRSSLPEIGGAAICSFNPEQPQAIADKIIDVISNPDLQQEMIKKGYIRLKDFSWKLHTDNILRAVE